MAESDIELDYDDNLDPDIYLDDEELEENESKNNAYQVNKNKIELDNDDNNNDYINDNEEDDIDVDDVDDNYDDYDKNDIDEDDDYDKNMNSYNNDNINFIDNELENDSKIQYIVKPEHRITSNILTIYEYTEIIGIRATQIAQGSPIFTNVNNITDPETMAKKELLDNRFPLCIQRYIGLDKYELWDPNTMAKPKL